MRFRRPTISCLLLSAALCCAAALVGCRSGGDTEALKRENFELNEQILALQVQKDQCCRELHATQDLLAAREHEAHSATPRRGTTTDDSSPSDVPKPPKIDLGTPGGKKEPTPSPKFEPAPKFDPGKAGAGGGPDAAAGPNLGQMHNVAARRDQPVAAITLDRQLTTGFDADDGRPGDEGLVVAIEPRVATGDAVRVPGEVKIVAYDAHLLRQYGAQPGKAQLAHVGTWLFTAADAATWFEEGQPRLRFELPWPPAGGPKSKDLHVVVHYRTADGRVLEAQAQVAVQLAGQRPKFAPALPPTTAPLRGGEAPGAPAAGTGARREFSALKKPAEPAAHDPATPEVSRAPTALPWHAEPTPPPAATPPAAARPGTEVPSRQRPVWTPFR